VGLSVAEPLFRVGRPHDAVQGLVPELAGMHDIDDYPQARTIPGLVVYRYDAPLFFANAQNFRRRALDDLQAFGLVQKIGEQRIFPTLPTAVAAHQGWARQHPQQGQDAAA